jgi:nucleotide-binding universal stress UspA family protein
MTQFLAPNPGAIEDKLLITPRLDRILIPTDFSPESLRAIEVARAILKGNANANITLVHVVGAIPPPELSDIGYLDPRIHDILRAHFEDKMTRIRSENKGDVEIFTHLTSGSPSREICAMVDEGQFDLIIMTSHGREGLRRLLLGNTAASVLHNAHCSVLVTKSLPSAQDATGEWNFAIKSILLGFDHRPGALCALGMANTLAKQTGAHLTLLHALQDSARHHAFGLLRDDDEVALHQASVAEGLLDLEETRSRYSPLSADWKIAAATGDSWEVLADHAREAGDDLIVVGPHEHIRWKFDFIGSTPQRVVRLAPCSVLVVK